MCGCDWSLNRSAGLRTTERLLILILPLTEGVYSSSQVTFLFIKCFLHTKASLAYDLITFSFGSLLVQPLASISYEWESKPEGNSVFDLLKLALEYQA
jgi:hypothetical protein